MLKRTHSWIFAAVCAIMIVSCEKVEESACDIVVDPSLYPIYPLAEGNEWHLKVFHNGISRDSSSGRASESGILEYQGQAWNSFKVYGTRYPEKGFLYSISETGSLYQLGICNQTDTLIQASLFFKYPVTEGDKWSTDIFVFRTHGVGSPEELVFQGTSNMECIEDCMEVTLEETKYSCIVYLLDDDSGPISREIQYHVVPGIGIVKERHVINNDTIEGVLYEYKVN